MLASKLVATSLLLWGFWNSCHRGGGGEPLWKE